MTQQLAPVVQTATATLSAAPVTVAPSASTGISASFGLSYAGQRRKRKPAPRGINMRIVAALLAADQNRRGAAAA